MHYLLFYDFVTGFLERRGKFRSEHLSLVWKSYDGGELILAGALADPIDSAVLLFQGDSPDVAERFARADPYVTGGLVTRWHVRRWNTVAGDTAASPVKPGV